MLSFEQFYALINLVRCKGKHKLNASIRNNYKLQNQIADERL